MQLSKNALSTAAGAEIEGRGFAEQHVGGDWPADSPGGSAARHRDAASPVRPVLPSRGNPSWDHENIRTREAIENLQLIFGKEFKLSYESCRPAAIVRATQPPRAANPEGGHAERRVGTGRAA